MVHLHYDLGGRGVWGVGAFRAAAQGIAGLWLIMFHVHCDSGAGGGGQTYLPRYASLRCANGACALRCSRGIEPGGSEK